MTHEVFPLVSFFISCFPGRYVSEPRLRPLRPRGRDRIRPPQAGDEKATPDAAGATALDAAGAALRYGAAELLQQLTERWIAAGPSEEICITLAPAEARQARASAGAGPPRRA